MKHVLLALVLTSAALSAHAQINPNVQAKGGLRPGSVKNTHSTSPFPTSQASIPPQSPYPQGGSVPIYPPNNPNPYPTYPPQSTSPYPPYPQQPAFPPYPSYPPPMPSYPPAFPPQMSYPIPPPPPVCCPLQSVFYRSN